LKQLEGRERNGAGGDTRGNSIAVARHKATQRKATQRKARKARQGTHGRKGARRECEALKLKQSSCQSGQTKPLPPSCSSSAGLWPFRVKGQENTTPSLVLGLFGLSQQTTEADLKALFGKYGEIDRLTLIYDKATGISRGFGFMYMKEQDGATAAKEALNGMDLHGRIIRVDYSLTSKPHDSTPGQYMGAVPGGRAGYGGGGGGGGGFRRDGPPPPPRGGGGGGGGGAGAGAGAGPSGPPKGPFAGYAPPAASSQGDDIRRGRSRSPPRGRDLDPPPASPPR